MSALALPRSRGMPMKYVADREGTRGRRVSPERSARMAAIVDEVARHPLAQGHDPAGYFFAIERLARAVRTECREAEREAEGEGVPVVHGATPARPVPPAPVKTLRRHQTEGAA